MTADQGRTSITFETEWLYGHISAPLGAISRAINEAIGRAMLADPALRDLLIRTGNAVDDVINDLEGAGFDD